MTAAPTRTATAVEITGLSKDFGTVRVLHDVDVSFAPGSIHALLGANGSGKSTLIKILAGFHDRTEGRILLHGNPLDAPITPAAVHAAGVRFVHQDLGLIDTLSVQDNLALALGYERGVSGTVNWRRQRASAAKDLEAVGLRIDPRTRVSELGPVQQTLVAMARAVRGLEPGKGVLVLDEPTARLPHTQVEELLDRCRALRDGGVALIYVSHRLDEVFAMADRVTVLRDGRKVFDDAVTATDEARLTAVITGREEVALPSTPSASGPLDPESAPGRAGRRRTQPERSDEVRLRTRGITGPQVTDVDLEVRRGEIVAVTGLIGSGRSELGRLIYGAQVMRSGKVEIDGLPVFRPTPRRMVGLGVGYVPQDRRQGGMAEFSVSENLALTDLPRLMRRGALSKKARTQMATRAVEAMDVRPADPERMLRELSGGNQQKVVMGKWLELDLKLLLLDEPTYGVDVGAREGIMGAVVERVRRDGLSVLLMDSDAHLVAAYADRVLVMRRGRVVAELTGEDVNVDAITDAAYATGAPVAGSTGTTAKEAG